MNPNVCLLLFAHPRSGSTSLYQILQLNSELNIIEEPFNENYTKWNSSNTDYRARVHDIPSLDEQVREIFTAHNGIKMLDYQLPDSLVVHLLQHPDYKIIFLRRRNILQAVVSVLIATQTALWKKWEMTKPLAEYYRDLQPLDVQDVRQRVRELKDHLDFFETVIDVRPEDTVIKLVYEDLYFAEIARQHQQIDSIWNLLGVAPLEPEQYEYYLRPECAKMNSEATYAFLPNAREIDECCGNDLTGWLFEKG
jgi:LPS sulfotransferase NodH